MMKNIDGTEHFGCAGPVYEVLTTMGKDDPCPRGHVAAAQKNDYLRELEHDIRRAGR